MCRVGFVRARHETWCKTTQYTKQNIVKRFSLSLFNLYLYSYSLFRANRKQVNCVWDFMLFSSPVSGFVFRIICCRMNFGWIRCLSCYFVMNMNVIIWAHPSLDLFAAIEGSIILTSCQVGSGCVRGPAQQTPWTIPPLHALMSYCTCGRSIAPAVTMTTRCRWLPPAPATGPASIRSTPTGGI